MAKKALKAFQPASNFSENFREYFEAGDDSLWPVYGWDRALEPDDLAYPGKKMEGKGHAGLDINENWDWEKNKYSDDPEKFTGYSGFGVPWDLKRDEAKAKILKLLAGTGQLYDHENWKNPVIFYEGTADKARIPDWQDGDAEKLYKGFTPKKRVLDPKLFKAIEAAIARAGGNEYLPVLRKAGLRPKWIDQYKREKLHLHEAARMQEYEDYAEQMVNRRPTEQWATGGSVPKRKKQSVKVYKDREEYEYFNQKKGPLHDAIMARVQARKYPYLQKKKNDGTETENTPPDKNLYPAYGTARKDEDVHIFGIRNKLGTGHWGTRNNVEPEETVTNYKGVSVVGVPEYGPEMIQKIQDDIPNAMKGMHVNEAGDVVVPDSKTVGFINAMKTQKIPVEQWKAQLPAYIKQLKKDKVYKLLHQLRNEGTFYEGSGNIQGR